MLPFGELRIGRSKAHWRSRLAALECCPQKLGYSSGWLSGRPERKMKSAIHGSQEEPNTMAILILYTRESRGSLLRIAAGEDR